MVIFSFSEAAFSSFSIYIYTLILQIYVYPYDSTAFRRCFLLPDGCRTEKADSAVFAVGSSLNNRYFENFYYYFCLYNQIYKMFLISFQ